MDLKDLNAVELEFLLEEFRALRSEIILCLERRITLISYGLATIGILTGAAVTSLNSGAYVAAGLIMAVIVPVASLYVLRIWLTETRRVRRASHYIWDLELRAEKIVGRSVLHWEQQIHDASSPAKGHFAHHYGSTVFFFTFIAASSVAAGLASFLLGGHVVGEVVAYIAGGSTGVVVFVFFFVPRKREADSLVTIFDEPPPFKSLSSG